jgi:hypothetical protein
MPLRFRSRCGCLLLAADTHSAMGGAELDLREAEHLTGIAD